ncbi:MAG: hypothetical protein GX589_03660 [Deltaproteobacteria bacterium]|nr:hypothetical protein [Deltaproteobacteria bacterium]
MHDFLSVSVFQNVSKVLIGLLPLLCACGVERAGRADRPGTISAEKIDQFEAAIEPYVKKARLRLPEVKRRFEKGLDEGETLYVVVRLPRSGGGFEQSYVVVKDWQEQDLLGRVVSRSDTLGPHPSEDPISFKETTILDWVIVKSDGYEEGNFVGRFLEGYRP